MAELRTSPTTKIRRFRAVSRPAWLAARASNVLKRRFRLAILVATASTAVLGAFVTLPAGVRGLWNLLRPASPSLRDTVAVIDQQRSLRQELAGADTALARAREALQLASMARVDALVAGTDPRADSLARIVAVFEPLIARAENAPLPETYRAIAESPALRDDARARALVDSLGDVERERDEFGAGAAVDPIYVSLTTRSNALGRAIVALAESRRLALRREISVLNATHASPAPVETPLPDTLAAAQRRDSLAKVLAVSSRAVGTARVENARVLAALSRARASGQLASFPVLLAASVVIGGAIAFILLLTDEIGSPRLATSAEAERLTDARVLTVIGPREVPAERMRRESDRERPSLLDPGLDAHRMMAWHITAMAPPEGLVVITGETAVIRATTAANIAAVLANEARGTLLIDLDFETHVLAGLLGARESPGMADVLQNRRSWSESIVQVTVGRGRTLDMIPSGIRSRALGPSEAEALGAETRRAARRYDYTIVSASLAVARRALPAVDVVLCAALARTRVSTLARSAAGLRDDGARILGVALWEGSLPSPPTAKSIDRLRRDRTNPRHAA
jgi:Mrp family chromosome partitioning ATPase